MSEALSFAGSGPDQDETPIAPAGVSNIDVPAFAGFFALCAVCYLGIYTLEAPVRYGLYLAGKDSLILLRDGLMFGPLVALGVTQLARGRLHPAFWAAGVLMAFHGLVLVGTVGNVLGAAYGAKILMNLVFGFFAASLLMAPRGWVLKAFILFWVLILIGALLDKFVMVFPWTGMETVVGDLSVDVSKDWQISDPFARRVAGFTRSSIAVAAVLPCLSIVLTCRLRSLWARAAIALPALAGVFLSTQKGSLIAFLPIAAILCLPAALRLAWLRTCFIAFLVLAAGLPLFTHGLSLEHGRGVFSMESLYLRIVYTWPDAWAWIEHHQMMWFGVGLGGIGGPQRLYAPDQFNPTDNIALLLYAYFGLFALLYVAFVVRLAFRPVTGEVPRAEAALAILAFAFGYGIVLSLIEDQSASLFLGAALGTLWLETAAGGPASRSGGLHMPLPYKGDFR